MHHHQQGTTHTHRAAAGRMTAVMQAAAAITGPRALRLGIVRGGRIVEERVFRAGVDVTIGSSEHATIIVDGPRIGASFVLFERADASYRLHVLDVMRGRVALESELLELGGRDRVVTLTDESRGRIEVGDATILFQFVVPPPPLARPQLPLAVKGGLASRIDWNLTILVAFSFLVHFGIVGAMLSDWMDPVVNDGISIAGLVDSARALPPAPVEPPPADVPSDVTPAPTPTPDPVATRESRSAPSQRSQPRATTASDAQANRLVNEAERMGIAILATLDGSPSLTRTIDRGDLPPVDLRDVATRNVGATTGTEVTLPSGASTVAPGRRPGLDAIAVTTRDGTRDHAGTERAVRAPTEAVIGVTPMSVPIANAERVVASLRPKFKRCYDKGLAISPDMSGSVTLATKVAPNGEIRGVDAQSLSGLDGSVVACLKAAVMGATFDAPGGTGSTIMIPVKFVHQAR